MTDFFQSVQDGAVLFFGVVVFAWLAVFIHGVIRDDSSFLEYVILIAGVVLVVTAYPAWNLMFPSDVYAAPPSVAYGTQLQLCLVGAGVGFIAAMVWPDVWRRLTGGGF
ncbi:hypothetical protein [Dyella sp. Tek66A03]|uniref:hypothetical protein n=1 Tax=Dyella sp. Tek66A03 TaxID=3458298 RepID=UPI00403EAF79